MLGPAQDALATAAAKASQAHDLLVSAAMPLVLRYGSLDQARANPCGLGNR